MQQLTFDFAALTKICTKCKAEKPVALFSTKILRGGQRVPGSWCRACVTAGTEVWRKANPERARQNMRRGKLKRHGITPEDYEALLAAQGGRCGICGTTQPTIWRVFDVDHDHVTGKVRGLLCQLCNRGLGQFGDDPERLRAAFKWVERYLENCST